MLSVNASTFEAVPKWHRLPRSVRRAQLRSAALAILAVGGRVSTQRLRECGVRGSTAALIALREELVAAGELPPEAAARVYARPVHPPGRARLSVDGCQLSSKLSVDSSQLSEKTKTKTAPSQPATDNRQLRTVNRQLTTSERRAQRRSRRLIQRYHSAVRRIFGRQRARQIGAAP